MEELKAKVDLADGMYRDACEWRNNLPELPDEFERVLRCLNALCLELADVRGLLHHRLNASQPHRNRSQVAGE